MERFFTVSTYQGANCLPFVNGYHSYPATGRNGSRLPSQAIERELLSNNFRVLICGEFKRGKSCLINALWVSSRSNEVAPCTGSITELTYGQMPLLTVYPEQGRAFSTVR